MDNRAYRLCGISAVLGMVAAATGFAVEANQLSPALALGIISAVFTIITQIYISVILGGAGCCPRERNMTPVPKFVFKLSWVASVVAVVLLVAAAGLSTRQSEGEPDGLYDIKCYVAKPVIFATGVTLALLSAVFGIGGYITLPPPPETDTNPVVALPIGANADLEKSPVHSPPSQHPHQ